MSFHETGTRHRSPEYENPPSPTTAGGSALMEGTITVKHGEKKQHQATRNNTMPKVTGNDVPVMGRTSCSRTGRISLANDRVVNGSFFVVEFVSRR